MSWAFATAFTYVRAALLARSARQTSRIFYGATSLEQAKAALDSFRREYRKIYRAAIGRLENDLDQSLTFYLFPVSHWKRIRTSNKLERTNQEIRRRLNVIGRHSSEDGCLSLVYQITKRHALRQRSFGCGELVQALWRRLRKEKVEMITQLQFAAGQISRVTLYERDFHPGALQEFPPNSGRGPICGGSLDVYK